MRWSAHQLTQIPSLVQDNFAVLEKNELKPHLIKQWVIPPEYNAQFVWRMEEILDLYEEPYDPNRPVVCFDERPCQLSTRKSSESAWW